MLHYWCLADLHTKFHVFAATRRSAATFWKIGYFQQSLKFEPEFVANCYKTKSCEWNGVKLYMLHYWCLPEFHTKFQRFHVSAATRRPAAIFLKDWVLPEIYKISKVFGLNLTSCIFWASLIDVEVYSNSQISGMLQNAANNTKICCQLF